MTDARLNECQRKLRTIRCTEELDAFRAGWRERFGGMTAEEFKLFEAAADRLRGARR